MILAMDGRIQWSDRGDRCQTAVAVMLESNVQLRNVVETYELGIRFERSCPPRSLRQAIRRGDGRCVPGAGCTRIADVPAGHLWSITVDSQSLHLEQNPGYVQHLGRSRHGPRSPEYRRYGADGYTPPGRSRLFLGVREKWARVKPCSRTLIPSSSWRPSSICFHAGAWAGR